VAVVSDKSTESLRFAVVALMLWDAATRPGLRPWTARVFTLRVPRSKQLTHAAEEPRIFELPMLGI
jgi:hypothetical protein